MFYVSLICDNDGTCAFDTVATHKQAQLAVINRCAQTHLAEQMEWDTLISILSETGNHTPEHPDCVYDADGFRIYISTDDFYR